MKICTKCKLEKDEIEFRVRKGKKPHHAPVINSSCRECEASDIKEWRNSNREKYREQKKRWRIKESSKKIMYECRERWAVNNPEKKKNSDRQYVLNNRGKVYEYQKDWANKSGHTERQNRRKVNSMTDCYIVDVLKKSGFAREQIINAPELLDWKRFQIAKKRLEKLINKHKKQ